MIHAALADVKAAFVTRGTVELLQLGLGLGLGGTIQLLPQWIKKAQQGLIILWYRTVVLPVAWKGDGASKGRWEKIEPSQGGLVQKMGTRDVLKTKKIILNV